MRGAYTKDGIVIITDIKLDVIVQINSKNIPCTTLKVFSFFFLYIKKEFDLISHRTKPKTTSKK